MHYDRYVLWAAGFLYLAGLTLGTISLIREKRHSRGLMYTIVLIGYILQTIGLGLRGQAVRGCPLGNTFEIFQFVAWAATSQYLLIGATFRLSMLGYFTSCLTAFMTLCSLSIPGWDVARNSTLANANPLIATHAGLAMFAYGMFAMLALTSALYLLRLHSLRSKRLTGWFSFLPPLVELDTMAVRLLGVGCGIMVCALGVGYLYWRLDDVTVDHFKLVSVVGLWLAYIIVFTLRIRGRLVGRGFAWACMLLYIAALFSLWPVDRSRHPVKSPKAPASQVQ